MSPEERKALEFRRAKLVKAKDEAVGQANQFAGGIAVIDSLLAEDRVEIASFPIKAASNGAATDQPGGEVTPFSATV